jgi:hypothetical protein
MACPLSPRLAPTEILKTINALVYLQYKVTRLRTFESLETRHNLPRVVIFDKLRLSVGGERAVAHANQPVRRRVILGARRERGLGGQRLCDASYTHGVEACGTFSKVSALVFFLQTT